MTILRQRESLGCLVFENQGIVVLTSQGDLTGGFM
jgi:hypothetical protein